MEPWEIHDYQVGVEVQVPYLTSINIYGRGWSS